MTTLTKILMIGMMTLSAATAFAGGTDHDRASDHGHTQIVRDRLAASASSAANPQPDSVSANGESTNCSSQD